MSTDKHFSRDLKSFKTKELWVPQSFINPCRIMQVPRTGLDALRWARCLTSRFTPATLICMLLSIFTFGMVLYCQPMIRLEQPLTAAVAAGPDMGEHTKMHHAPRAPRVHHASHAPRVHRVTQAPKVQQPIQPKLIFVHIPKTGGPSVESAVLKAHIVRGGYDDICKCMPHAKCAKPRSDINCPPWHDPDYLHALCPLFSRKQRFNIS